MDPISEGSRVEATPILIRECLSCLFDRGFEVITRRQLVAELRVRGAEFFRTSKNIRDIPDPAEDDKDAERSLTMYLKKVIIEAQYDVFRDCSYHGPVFRIYRRKKARARRAKRGL